MCGPLVAEIPNLSTIRLRAVPTFRLSPSCPKTQWKKMMLVHSAEVYFSCASAPRFLRGVVTSLFFFRGTVRGLRWSKLFSTSPPCFSQRGAHPRGGNLSAASYLSGSARSGKSKARHDFASQRNAKTQTVS